MPTSFIHKNFKDFIVTLYIYIFFLYQKSIANLRKKEFI